MRSKGTGFIVSSTPTSILNSGSLSEGTVGGEIEDLTDKSIGCSWLKGSTSATFGALIQTSLQDEGSTIPCRGGSHLGAAPGETEGNEAGLPGNVKVIEAESFLLAIHSLSLDGEGSFFKLSMSLNGDALVLKQLMALAERRSSSGSAEDAPLSDSELFDSVIGGFLKNGKYGWGLSKLVAPGKFPWEKGKFACCCCCSCKRQWILNQFDRRP